MLFEEETLQVHGWQMRSRHGSRKQEFPRETVVCAQKSEMVVAVWWALSNASTLE